MQQVSFSMMFESRCVLHTGLFLTPTSFYANEVAKFVACKAKTLRRLCLNWKEGIMKKHLLKLAPVMVVAVLLIIWELVVQLLDIPLYVLPAPSDMLKTFVTEFPILAGHAGVTVMEALVGMGISFFVGILTGIVMDAMPLVRRCIYPILVVTQTVPVIVLAPIFIIYMGFGYAPKILTVVLMCFFPIVVSFCDGLGEMDQGYLNLVKTYGGSKWQIYRIVKIPGGNDFTVIRSEGRGHLQHQRRQSSWRMDRCHRVVLAIISTVQKMAICWTRYLACVLMIVILSLLMNGAVKLFGYVVLPSRRRHRRRI